MRFLKAMRLAAALVLLAGAIGTGWMTALATTWSERVEDLGKRGLVRSVAERRAPREPAAVQVHRGLAESLSALRDKSAFAEAAQALNLAAGTFPTEEPALRALVSAGGQELAALDAFLAEAEAARLAKSDFPSAIYADGARAAEIETAAVYGLAAGAILCDDPNETAERLGRALDLARLLDDGTSLSLMLAGVQETGVLTLVHRALACESDGHRIAEELGPRLQLLAAQGRAERALRYDMDAFVAGVREASQKSPTGVAALVGRWADPLRFGAYNAWLDDYERCVDVARLAPDELLVRCREGQMQRLQDGSRLSKWAPAYLEFVDRFELDRARLALARAALDLERQSPAGGAWPDDLSGIPSALDPHTGQPFPYAVGDGRAILGPPAWAAEKSWTDAERRSALLIWEHDA